MLGFIIVVSIALFCAFLMSRRSKVSQTFGKGILYGVLSLFGFIFWAVLIAAIIGIIYIYVVGN